MAAPKWGHQILKYRLAHFTGGHPFYGKRIPITRAWAWQRPRYPHLNRPRFMLNSGRNIITGCLSLTVVMRRRDNTETAVCLWNPSWFGLKLDRPGNDTNKGTFKMDTTRDPPAGRSVYEQICTWICTQIWKTSNEGHRQLLDTASRTRFERSRTRHRLGSEFL